MLLTIFLCVFLFGASAKAAPTTDNNELLSVIVVYRHGERSPVWAYPNDPHNYEEVFPDPPGQLSNEGKQRHFELGQWFRNRYSNFLSPKFSVDDIHIASTDVDRTLMSAASNLAGLYPPQEEQVWNANIPWQPIPIHTANLAVLNMLNGCPKFTKLWQENLGTGFYKSLDQENADLYDYLTEHTGENITDLTDLYMVRDTLFIEAHSGLTLPDWALKVYPDKIEPIAGNFWASTSSTPELARLTSGPFLKNVIEHFQKVIDNTSAYQKFLMFSGHDSCISAILSGLGAFEPHSPFFASTIIFELRKINGEYVVRIDYKNEGEISPVVVKGCVENCKFADFWRSLGDMAITKEEWERQCYLGDVQEQDVLVEKFGYKIGKRLLFL